MRNRGRGIGVIIIAMLTIIVMLPVAIILCINSVRILDESHDFNEKVAAITGAPGINGTNGADGINGVDGKDGTDGKDGLNGIDGEDGINGKDGADGISAYNAAVDNGYVGTLSEWLESLRGNDGNGIRNVVTRDGRLICILDDGTEIDVGEFKIPDMDIPELRLPAYVNVLKGTTSWFYNDEIIASDKYSLKYVYYGSGTRIYTDEGFAITPDTVGETQLTVTLFNNNKALREKTITLNVIDPDAQKPVTVLFIGDSRLSDGTIPATLANIYGNKMTFIGTCINQNTNIASEGRGSWSALNFLKYEEAFKSKNPFYNPDNQRTDENGISYYFDFEYYLRTTGQAAPDAVVFYLGANDLFTAQSVHYTDLMITSVKDYANANNKDIKVFVMTEYLSYNSSYYLTANNNVDIRAKRELQYSYLGYQNSILGNREDEDIYIVPDYLCVGGVYDRKTDDITIGGETYTYITDAVHLGYYGYKKVGAMLAAYINAAFQAESGE